ncbi:cytochrome P450 [Mycena sanguinolenta]|nr:cytochrome P450 [Mycena sanguinolenta]
MIAEHKSPLPCLPLPPTMVFSIPLVGRDLEVSPVSALLTILGLWALRGLLKTVRLLVTPSLFPRIRTAFQPLGLPGALLPTTSWTTGLDWNWVRRFDAYAQGETVAITPLLVGPQALWTSNMEIGRQVIVGSHKASFYKSAESTSTLLIWGMNLIASDGQMWRKHRHVFAPAFNNELYKLVWAQTTRTYKDMVQTDGWDTKDVVDVPVVQKLTVKLAFLIIASCGFGFESSWATPPSTDGVMSVTEALRLVSDYNLLLTFAPEWLLYLPFAMFTKARMARDRLKGFMRAQIVERKADVAAGSARADAFTMLVKANQDESTKYQLDDEELIGNIFILMFAGHETTASTLAATLAFMAIHDDLQEEVLAQIISVVGTKSDPQLEDYSKLDKVLAIFYEALRMFPPAYIMIREATEDTILTVPNPPGEEGSKSVPITKGTQIVVDMVGVQYNSRYFEKPAEYRPSRWYGLPAESELFTAFSVGPRACIGRKFAAIEATSFLTLLLRDWKVAPLLRDGETKAAWGARMKDARMGITLSVAADIPLRLERRTYPTSA